jgi:hypothetical protein
MFTRSRHWSVFWARWNYSTPFPVTLRYILLLSAYLLSGLYSVPAQTNLHPLILALNKRSSSCSVVGWGTMLQAGRSPVRVPDQVDFFNLPNSCSRTMALVSTQPLAAMSTRNFPGGKKRPTRRADNLTAICEPNVWKCGSLNQMSLQLSPSSYSFKLKLLPYVRSSVTLSI